MGKHYNLYEQEHGASGHAAGLLLRQSKNQLRRVWVKRPAGTPTTIMIGCDQIVDDLKQAVVNKFPNSLARHFDPAEIQILVRGGLEKSHHSGRRSKKKMQPKNLALSSDDVSTKGTAALAANNTGNSGVAVGTGSSVATGSLAGGTGSVDGESLWQDVDSYIILAPDQNVWDVINDYYGGTMLIEDAFLVDVEPNESVPPKGRDDDEYQILYDQDPHQKLVDKLPLLQLRLADTRSPSSLPDQIYHQPRPQYPHYANHVYSGQPAKSAYSKTLSASPNFGARVGLLHSASTLPKLTRVMLPGSPGPFNASSAKNSNSQPVLLLPKNFSLGEQHANKAGHIDSSAKSLNGKHNGLGGDTRSNLTSREEMDPHEGEFQDEPSAGEHEKVISSAAGHSRHNSDTAATSLNGGHAEVPKSLPLTKTTSSKSHITGTVQRPHEVKGASSSSSKSKDKNTLSTFEKVLPLISVLVVEDNSINQAILGAFLRKHKIHYQIAKNGQEAVDKWRKGGFHLVLMDIQLPVKSGIEATKEIRNLEKINRIGVFAQHELTGTGPGQEEVTDEQALDLDMFRSPVIIVALTASSNSSVDKKNALTAGCNDFLTKPVNLVWLQNKITEWGCMQALIDFDGWKDKRTKAFSSTGKDVKV